MPEQNSIFELRYTLPGLVYFAVVYACLIFYNCIAVGSCSTILLSDKLWIALGAIALVASVPVGYIVHQGYLFWSYLNGRIEHYDHIQALAKLVKSSNAITVKLDCEEIPLDGEQLRSELLDLGKKYLEKVTVLWHRKEIEEYGCLTPLHDLIFLGDKEHDALYRGPWQYARITRTILGTFVLALAPWIVGYMCNSLFPMRSTVALVMIGELLFLLLVSWFVSEWSRWEVDIYEQFLTWIWSKGKYYTKSEPVENRTI